MSQLKGRLLLPASLAFIALALATTPASADWLIDSTGTLLKLDPSLVLGDSVTSPRSAPTATNQRPKTGKTEYTLEPSTSKLKVTQTTHLNNGRTQEKKLELGQEEALQVQLENNERLKLRLHKDGLEITDATLSARTNLPVKVGEKNEITVTLPNGKTKEIAIPDKALSHLLEKGILTATGSAETSYQLTAGKNGEPVYVVPDAQVEKKFLGVLPLKFRSTVEVSADEQGEIVNATSTETHPLRRFLEFLSR